MMQVAHPAVASQGHVLWAVDARTELLESEVLGKLSAREQKVAPGVQLPLKFKQMANMLVSLPQSKSFIAHHHTCDTRQGNANLRFFEMENR